MRIAGHDFAEVVLADFEFIAPPGDRPTPVCLVARELVSGRTHRIFQDELLRLREPPYAAGRDVLFVAFYASAELGCYLALGWEPPQNILDLYAEQRVLTNGAAVNRGLLGTLAYYGLDSIDAAEKDAMRDLILRGGPWSTEEQAAILAYCESDVRALAALLPVMEARIDLPRALVRGRYMCAAARIEWNGVPIDAPMLSRLRVHWDRLKDRLVDADPSGVYEAGSFRKERFAAFLRRRGVAWPFLESGELDLTDQTFREMARVDPDIATLRELRHALSQLRLEDLAVGRDDRNRVLLGAFGSKTGRNTPSNSRFIFGPSVWIRALIKPGPGRAVAYIDWAQQEIAIAAALSGDENLQRAYSSGDSYLSFAKLAGAVPPDGTRAEYEQVRDLYKSTMLGVGYGMGAASLAARIGKATAYAEDLLRRHREVFHRYWRWSRAALDRAMVTGTLEATFGWKVRVSAETSARSLANFPMQANGAEMLRIACILAVEQGIQVCAPVHDAILIEAADDEIDAAVAATRECMAVASEIVLGGFRLETDVKIVRSPDRYLDRRGVEMWTRVVALLEELEAELHTCIVP